VEVVERGARRLLLRGHDALEAAALKPDRV
jgi:hypothetical protein